MQGSISLEWDSGVQQFTIVQVLDNINIYIYIYIYNYFAEFMALMFSVHKNVQIKQQNYLMGEVALGVCYETGA